MNCNRRKALRLAGGTLSIGTLAGCLASGTDAGDNGDGDNGDGDNGGPDDDGRNDESDDDANGSDDTSLPSGLERVDAPPYEITEGECGSESETERDPLYLCAEMAAEPSLSFEIEELSRGVLVDEGLGTSDSDGGSQFYATLLTEEEDLNRIASESAGLTEEAESPSADLIDGTEFDEEAILIVQTGWGSSAETPYLKRIEETDDGIRAFGCHRRPCAVTMDYTFRTVVARFDRPAVLDSAVISLTVDPETRINVAAGEGVVTIDTEE